MVDTPLRKPQVRVATDRFLQPEPEAEKEITPGRIAFTFAPINLTQNAGY
jgi:hypothetical protein